MREFLAISNLLLLSMWIAGCGVLAQPAPATPPPSAPVASHGGPVDDYVSLIDGLRAAGASVEPAGEVRQTFFAVPGQKITVNGEDVQVFEHPTAVAAEAAAATVSSDGSSVGTTMITWVAPPHFYRQGRLVVLYVGSSQKVLQALEGVLGPPFAGR